MGADMELASRPLLRRIAFQRLLPAMMMIALVLAFLAGVTWFIRSFILPPRYADPNPADVAAAPPAAVSPSTKDTSPDPATARPQAASTPAGLPDPLAPSSGSVTTTAHAAVDVDPATTGSAPHVSTVETGATPVAAAPMPLPQSRQQEFVTVAGPTPPPRPRQATRRTRTNSQIYNRHRAE
jgi:cytoskeletal protein RodZ